MSDDKIKKKYVDSLVAGAAVRDSKGKVISASLETIDNEASLLDNVVVTDIEVVPNLTKVRTGGTIITTEGVEIDDAFMSEPETDALELSYLGLQQEPKEFELLMPDNVADNSSGEQEPLTLSYIE